MTMEPSKQEVNPLVILQQAIEKGSSIEQIMVLMELAERWEANQARKAFYVAFGEFKSESVSVVKNVMVKDGPLKDKKYADKFGVVSAIVPFLSKHGLSHSWKLTIDKPEWLEVTCTLQHVLGHSVNSSMGGAPDTGPGRNAIQARSSANSYLERITFLAVTGMAASDEDKDGAADFDFQPLIDSIRTSSTVEMLKERYQTAAKKAIDLNMPKILRILTDWKDARKKEIEDGFVKDRTAQ
jgi:hypothetical protein